jgi:hypothetical protein
MDVLAPLDQLEAIEINRFRAEDGTQIPLMLDLGVLFNPTRRFFNLLNERHPSLRRVLLIARQEIKLGPTFGPPPVLWRRSEGWTSGLTSYLEYWDILCDRLDDFRV